MKFSEVADNVKWPVKHPPAPDEIIYTMLMTSGTLKAHHHQLDLAVDCIYRSKPFASDEEHLEHLFRLYEEMTAKEKQI